MYSTSGEMYGYVECSFSMSVDPNRIRVFYPSKYSSKTYNEDTVKALQDVSKGIWKDVYGKVVEIDHTEIYRVGSKKCPVKINWTPRFNTKTSKYEYRNLPFVKK